MFRATAVTIACIDLARSVRFYEQALGAVPDPRDGYGCRWYKLGDLSITLFPNASETSPARMPNHPMTMLWLETDDLAAAARRFAELGVQLIQPSDGQSLMIADPDGVVIEVWQADPAGSA